MPYTPTYAAGFKNLPDTSTPITAASLNAMSDELLAYNTAWTTFTPTWAGTGGAPSIGNGTLTGRYSQIGKTVIVAVALTFGSTTTANSATAWTFSLPLIASSSAINMLFAARAFQSSTSTRYAGYASLAANSSTASVVCGNAATATVGALVPFTWAAGDTLGFSGLYETA